MLRYLPANLAGPEIAAELYVSHNTIKTHVRNLYMKLGTHRRAEAVGFGGDLDLLAPAALANTWPGGGPKVRQSQNHLDAERAVV